MDPYMNTHVHFIVKFCLFLVDVTVQIKAILSKKNLESVIHAFITCRLDYCNVFFMKSARLQCYKKQLYGIM